MSIPEDTRQASEAYLKALEEYNPRPEIEKAIREFQMRRQRGAAMRSRISFALAILALAYLAYVWWVWREDVIVPFRPSLGAFTQGALFFWAMQRLWHTVGMRLLRRQAANTVKQTLGFWIVIASGAGMAAWAFYIGMWIAHHLNSGMAIGEFVLRNFVAGYAEKPIAAITPFVILWVALRYGLRLIRESTEEAVRS